MNMNEYQDLAARTINRKLSLPEATRHALFGLCGEVGEIHSIFQKSYQGHQISYIDLRNEIGDVMWMVAELCTVHGWNLDDICRENIEKLRKRYTEGFAEERSLHREE